VQGFGEAEMVPECVPEDAWLAEHEGLGLPPFVLLHVQLTLLPAVGKAVFVELPVAHCASEP
jgi:hypothetical protein